MGTRLAHAAARPPATIGRCRPGRVINQNYLEAVQACIEDGREHADVLRQTPDPQAPDSRKSKLIGQTRLVESRVLILVEAHTLGNLYDGVGQLEPGDETAPPRYPGCSAEATARPAL